MNTCRRLLTCYCLLSWGLLAAAEDAPWRTLPLIRDGQVHSDWMHTGYGSFVVDGDSLRTECDERGMGLLVYKPEKFGDCQIRVVYKSKDARSNAGVYVRIDEGILHARQPAPVKRDSAGKLSKEMLAKLEAASNAEEGPWYAVHHGYEVQICDGADAAHRTGAIYSLSQAETIKSPAGEWRTMLITLRGTLIEVQIDGQPVSRFDSQSKPAPRKIWHEPKREPQRPQRGYLGLQNHDPGDVVWFKEVAIRPLAP